MKVRSMGPISEVDMVSVNNRAAHSGFHLESQGKASLCMPQCLSKATASCLAYIYSLSAAATCHSVRFQYQSCSMPGHLFNYQAASVSFQKQP